MQRARGYNLDSRSRDQSRETGREFLGQSKRLWSSQLWREAEVSCETGGREAGTKHQVWLVHIWVSLGEQ